MATRMKERPSAPAKPASPKETQSTRTQGNGAPPLSEETSKRL